MKIKDKNHRVWKIQIQNCFKEVLTYSWGSFGKEHELFAAVKEFDLTTSRLLSHYKKCTGLSEKVIREKLLPPHDVWLDSKQAKKLGLCDSVKEMRMT